MAESVPVTISGISGRFPQSDDIYDFKRQLYSGIDMVTVDGKRFTPGLYGTPERSGKLKVLNKFDNDFFSISPKQAHLTDPMLRMLLECTSEAMFDAGVNPAEMRGSRTGVYIGTTTTASESEEFWLRNVDEINGLSGLGCCRAMFANRISYNFDLKGPSFPIDSTCASSLLCLDLAVSAIRDGRCDSAIVAGVNVCLKPEATLKLLKLGVLSIDGKCKAFDATASGYVRSEAVVVFFIQKHDVVRRRYVDILATRTLNDGFKELGMLGPDGSEQIQLLETVYSDAKVDPKDVTYIETHGSGTQRGDMLELGAISEVICKRRNGKPLMVGSLKTNCGHSEPASGLLSIVKIIISLQEHQLPGNLHFKVPNPNIPGLFDGSIKVVTENTPWEGGICGASAFGIGGSNVHAVFKSNSKLKSKNEDSDINYSILVNFSGRTQEAVESGLTALAKASDLEQIGLVQEFFKLKIPNHPFRGFGIIQNGKTITLESNEFNESEPKRPVWWVFSGMGSQWGGMGQDLMMIEPFRATIHKLAIVLQNNCAYDLMDILESGTNETFENVLNAFVSIVAIQIALVDTLRSIGIPVDGLIGHSVGELSCAYADNCLSAEQTILAAYWRGKVLLDSNLPEGAMAAIGLSWTEALKNCPEGIYPACHNSKDNVTVSGPTALIQAFIGDLNSKGIFAREVNSSKIAFHSKYVEPVRNVLHEKLSELIPQPKLRSKKWVSTSTLAESPFSSAEYHTNNVLSPVLFHGALSQIPENAIVLEIGPHAILQAILKRSLHSTAKYIPLMNKNAANNTKFILESIGKLYCLGIETHVGKLYKPIQFPVSLETPFLFPLIGWDHSDTWNVANFMPPEPQPKLKLEEEEHKPAPPSNINWLYSMGSNLLTYIWNGSPKTKTPRVLPSTFQAEKFDLIDFVLKTLGIPEFNRHKIKPGTSFGELGMDSMLGAELKNILEENFGLVFSMEQILQLNFESLQKLNTISFKKPVQNTVTAQSKNGAIKLTKSVGNGITTTNHCNSTTAIPDGNPYVDCVIKSLGINDLQKIDLNKSLGELGMDSMLGVEIKNLLETKLKKEITMASVLHMTLIDVQKL